MGDFWTRLGDTAGFVPRKACGNWTPELIWLHVGSDLAIWMAYVSIPLVLVYIAAQHRRLPFKPIFVLFAGFILACGSTHFLDAMMFEFPAYRALGLMKAATALISVGTVVALVPTVPLVLGFVRRVEELGGAEAILAAAPPPLTAAHPDFRPPRRWGRQRDYAVAVGAAAVTVGVRAILDPILGSDHVFVLSLLAVVFVAWQCGFGPALVTLATSMTAFIYLFVQPRYSFVVGQTSDMIAVAMFAFCGFACAVLGEAQRVARGRAVAALAEVTGHRDEIEAEVVRRRAVEASLLQRDAALTDINTRLTAAQAQTADALALLDTFVMNAPVGLAFYDAALRYVRVNECLARANGRPVDDHIGKTPTQVMPGFDPELLAEYRRVIVTREPVYGRRVAVGEHGPTADGGGSWR